MAKRHTPCQATPFGFQCRKIHSTCVLGPNRERSIRDESFKRLDSVRALTYKRWPTELINNFAHGGSRDEVSQWELNKNTQELAMTDVFVIESIHGTTVSNLKTAVCSQNTLYIAVYSHKMLLRLFPLVAPPRNEKDDEMTWTWR